MVYAQRRIPTSAPMRTRRRPSLGSSPRRRAKFSKRRRKADSMAVLAQVRRFGEPLEPAADDDSENEPGGDQRDVHVRELTRSEAQPPRSGEHEPRREHVAEPHEEGV